MRLFGLIGFPLSHSGSPAIFSEIFHESAIENASYVLFELKTLEELNDLLTTRSEIEGFNVTIPYKKQIISLMHVLDGTAVKAGAVNCVRVKRPQEKIVLEGFNTDYPAFLHTLEKTGINFEKKALILGTGGSSGAVAAALKDKKIKFLTVSRSKNRGDISYTGVSDDIMKDVQLIINTTPLGMYPGIEKYPPLPYHYLTPHHICYDLVYNPPMTLFLQKSAERGAIVVNGEEMLNEQARLSWGIWKGMS
jgi:shikimate dehydrogenase